MDTIDDLLTFVKRINQNKLVFIGASIKRFNINGQVWKVRSERRLSGGFDLKVWAPDRLLPYTSVKALETYVESLKTINHEANVPTSPSPAFFDNIPLISLSPMKLETKDLQPSPKIGVNVFNAPIQPKMSYEEALAVVAQHMRKKLFKRMVAIKFQIEATMVKLEQQKCEMERMKNMVKRASSHLIHGFAANTADFDVDLQDAGVYFSRASVREQALDTYNENKRCTKNMAHAILVNPDSYPLFLGRLALPDTSRIFEFKNVCYMFELTNTLSQRHTQLLKVR